MAAGRRRFLFPADPAYSLRPLLPHHRGITTRIDAQEEVVRVGLTSFGLFIPHVIDHDTVRYDARRLCYPKSLGPVSWTMEQHLFLCKFRSYSIMTYDTRHWEFNLTHSNATTWPSRPADRHPFVSTQGRQSHREPVQVQ